MCTFSPLCCGAPVAALPLGCGLAVTCHQHTSSSDGLSLTRERSRRRSVTVCGGSRSLTSVPCSVLAPAAVTYAHGLLLGDRLGESAPRSTRLRMLLPSLDGSSKAMLSRQEQVPQRTSQAGVHVVNSRSVFARFAQSSDARSTQSHRSDE
jgi:hypothetical protein